MLPNQPQSQPVSANDFHCTASLELNAAWGNMDPSNVGYPTW